jgi:hypothetical protein
MTNLPPEDVIVALETNAQQAYEQIMRNFARLTLMHLALVAKRIDANARYVVLDDSDQTIGEYVIVGLNSNDEEIRDHGDDFQDVPMNICGGNELAWTEFLGRDLGGDHGASPYYLDIDKVISEYPTWETS